MKLGDRLEGSGFVKESNLDLFFMFIKGDHRAPRKYAELKKNLPIKELDIPLLNYTISLKDRIDRLSILHSKIIQTNEEAIREIEYVYKNGRGYYIKGLELGSVEMLI
ncbi:hypothetical protein [uncultured Methanomethylovorans sp.]|uniref:hypothetical protein n=1 Tax=uncultured Methanomethylovorans sp. TaxID=183759 RepID=UPI002AA7C68C|nr:hypothetical protein [uncultured Methanomethylovorans sp.]